MKRLAHLFRQLANWVHDFQVRRREAYLATAVDIYDLEWRLREFERAAQHATFH